MQYAGIAEARQCASLRLHPILTADFVRVSGIQNVSGFLKDRLLRPWQIDCYAAARDGTEHRFSAANAGVF
jgi:hypothetical protein